jgi:AraC-like DNA-binding protein
LRSSLVAGHCSEEQIAALFTLRARTLSRRLESFGTSFRELAEESRFEIARQMLENTSLPVGQIATALYYTRSSSFIRAFRRWAGTTPAEWRKTHADHVTSK